MSYRNHWFWIDDRDVKSKVAFNFLMLAVFAHRDRGRQGGGPNRYRAGEVKGFEDRRVRRERDQEDFETVS